jgi:hypothetical protein
MENNFSKGMREGGQNPTESYGEPISPENRNRQNDQGNTEKEAQAVNKRQNFNVELESQQEGNRDEDDARSKK